MKWALVDEKNVVQNVIVYDEKSDYQAPAGLSLMKVEDWVNTGDLSDKQAEPALVDDQVKLKYKRNEYMCENLALIACFEMEKKSRPDLLFSDYVDSLEAKAKVYLDSMKQ